MLERAVYPTFVAGAADSAFDRVWPVLLYVREFQERVALESKLKRFALPGSATFKLDVVSPVNLFRIDRYSQLGSATGNLI